MISCVSTVIMAELAGKKMGILMAFGTLFPSSTLSLFLYLCPIIFSVVSCITWSITVCFERTQSHVESLATLAGLHNHIGQLLHLVLPAHVVEDWQWL